jgi:hypothetical protein
MNFKRFPKSLIRPPLSLLVLGSLGWGLVSISPVHGASPPPRTGLWAMQRLPENESGVAQMAAEAKANPNLSGICLHVAWTMVEKQAGQPDFSAVDRAVKALRGIGMKYQLCLKPGANTPDFVYEQGAKAFPTRVTNPHRANVGQEIRIPVPWDPVFEKNFSRIIQELGKRYSSDPLCVSVVLTCANALSAEMHLPKRPEDRARWRSFGNYETKLLEVYKKFTDEWATSFPRQEVSLHLSKVLDLPASFNNEIIDYGMSKYPDRFSIQNCQLSGRKEDLGVLTYDIIMKYRGRLHHGFQSLAGLSKPNDRMGSIEMAALNIVHADGEYWELWHGDGFSPETSAAVLKAWNEAKRLGYEDYKKKLISDGKYRQR